MFNFNRQIAGRGGRHFDGIGTVYKAERRGIAGYGALRPQTGTGIANFLSRIFSRAVPFLKNTLMPSLKPALNEVKNSITGAAANVVEDVIQGENVGQSVKKNILSEGRKLLAKAPAAFSGLLRSNKSPEDPIQTQSTKQATSRTARKRRKIPPRLTPASAKRGRGSSSKKFPALNKFC